MQTILNTQLGSWLYFKKKKNQIVFITVLDAEFLSRVLQ